MAARKKQPSTLPTRASTPQDPVSMRIEELRVIGAIERVYIGTSHFDGVPLQVAGPLTPSIDELVAPCDPSDTNNGYGGLFQLSRQSDQKPRSGELTSHVQMNPYVAVDTNSLAAVIKNYLGTEAGKYINPVDLANPNNIRVHLIPRKESGQLHVFFVPSDEYIEDIQQEMKAPPKNQENARNPQSAITEDHQ